MAEDTTRTSNRRLNSGASEYNAISFMVENMIKGMVNTAIPVRVDSCTKPGPDGAAGYVSATPLVMQRGADGKSLQPVSLPQLPFYRVQAGTAAVVLDPQPGDVGLAVFSQQDASNIEAGKTDPVQAGSFRAFDMSDGFFVSCHYGKTPTVYVELEQDMGVTVKTPANEITIDKDGGNVNVKAQAKITLEAPTIELKGALMMGNSAGSGTGDTMKITGNLDVTGSVSTAGNVSAGHFYGPVN
jgi:hypothetical protein